MFYLQYESFHEEDIWVDFKEFSSLKRFLIELPFILLQNPDLKATKMRIVDMHKTGFVFYPIEGGFHELEK